MTLGTGKSQVMQANNISGPKEMLLGLSRPGGSGPLAARWALFNWARRGVGVQFPDLALGRNPLYQVLGRNLGKISSFDDTRRTQFL